MGILTVGQGIFYFIYFIKFFSQPDSNISSQPSGIQYYPQLNDSIYFSSGTYRSNSRLLDGASISDDVYIFVPMRVNSNQKIARIVNVTFYFDSSSIHESSPYQIEGRAPFDLAGTFNNGTAAPFNVSSRFAPGQHNLTALIADTTNLVNQINASFTVIDKNKPQNPTVTSVSPANNSVNVCMDTDISLNLALFSGGVSVPSLLIPNAVGLYDLTNGNIAIPGFSMTSGGGDVLVFKPLQLLPNTSYELVVTPKVLDTSNVPFNTFTSYFTTDDHSCNPKDSNVNFNMTTLFTGYVFSSLLISPDHTFLYAGSLNGVLRRFPIKSDGTLGTVQQVKPVGEDAIIGMTFDPIDSTILWISHSYTITYQVIPPDFTGSISKITIAPDPLNFAITFSPYITNLPRSGRDHVTNSLAFGPDGFLYTTQGSSSSLGSPDEIWFNRPEHMLTATVLRIDPRRTVGIPANVQTEDYVNNLTGKKSQGSYDPTAPNAIVTIFAYGLRNAFDLVFHSNGNLYCPANGSGSGGNSPASPNGTVPALLNGPLENDYLHIIQQGKYYGHPNPVYEKYVINGGNPTSAVDPAEFVTIGVNTGYPVGVQPDPDYKTPAYVFGYHQSPDGALEYQSATFNGALKGKLVVCRYSVGSDIVALDVSGPGGSVVGDAVTIAGGFTESPLDVVEHLPTGNLYVSTLTNSKSSIILLSPQT